MIDTLFRFAGLLGLLAALSNTAHSGSANPPWLLSGHASVGLLYNDSDAQYYRELSQRGAQFGHWAYENDTRFGLRLAYRPNQEISGELQLLTKYGPSGDFQTNLVSALTRVRLAGGWMLRTGIIPLESYYRSDSMHVGLSYLWARPPSEVYSYHTALNYTGLALHKFFSTGQHSFEAKLYGGKMLNPLSTHMDDQYKLYGSDTFGFGLEYNSNDWTINFGHNELQLDDRALLSTEHNPYFLNSEQENVDPALVALFKSALVDSNEIIYQYLGVDYQLNHWRINAMLSRADSGLRTIKNGYTSYLSLAYKMNRLTPYWRISYSRFHAPDKLAIDLPEAWQAFILTEFQDAQSNQINHALGLRYDVNEHLALKAQVNHIHSKVNPTFLWNYETEQWAQRANFFSLVVDVSF